MGAILKNTTYKIKSEVHSYLYNNSINPVFDFIEKKIHLERSIIVFGMLFVLVFIFHIMIICLGLLGIFASYLVIGWANDFLCNFIGVLYPAYAS